MHRSWKDLLARRRVERREAAADEIRELLAAVDRQLANARLEGLTPDGRLQHVFSAARLAATVAIRAEPERLEAGRERGGPSDPGGRSLHAPTPRLLSEPSPAREQPA